MNPQKIFHLFCALVLALGAMLTIAEPVSAASEWAGQTNGGASSNGGIYYSGYNWIVELDRNQVIPYSDTAAFEIWQDAYQSGFLSNSIELDRCTLRYAPNSSNFSGSSWTEVTGVISAVSGSNNDRCKFNLDLAAGNDYMLYVVYEEGSTTWYGYPGVSNFTTAPTSQTQTYKIHRIPASTYQTLRIDGKEWDWNTSANLLGTDGRSAPDTTSFYLAWDEDNLYVRISGGFGNTDRLNIGIDTNPGTNDLSGSNVTNGFAKAQFAGYLVPDYIIQSTGTTNLDKYTRSSNSWGSASSIYASGANLYRSGSEAEIRIPRSTLASPNTIGLYFWLANNSDNMYTCYGVDKPGNCNISSDDRLRSALVFDNLGSGQVPATAGQTDYNASQTYALSISSGVRHLYISNGTSQPQTNLTLSGNLTIANGASFKILSGVTALTIAGNLHCDGTLSGIVIQNGNVILNGQNQTISGSGTILIRNLLFQGSGIKTIDNNLTTTNIKINSNVTVNAGDSTITLYGGTTIPLFFNNGSFDAGTSTIAFRGYNNLNSAVLGSSNTTFYDVSLTCANAASGGSCIGRFGVDFRDQKSGAASRATIAHNLTLNNSTFVADEELCDDPCNTTELDGTPIYAVNSTLIYNNGGSFDSAAEWKAPNAIVCGETPGTPYNVVIQNGTALNISAAYIIGEWDNIPTDEYADGANKRLCGNLTIANGSSLTSTAGILNIDGNWTNDGSFTHNNGIVKFIGSGEQQILGSNNTVFNAIYNRSTASSLVLNDLSTNGASAQSFYNYGIYRRSWAPVAGQAHSFGLARLTIAIDSVSGSSPSIQVDRIDQDSSHKTGSWPTWGVGNKIHWKITPANITSIQADLSAPTTAGAGSGLLNGTASLVNGPTFVEDDHSTLCRYAGSVWDCRNNDTIHNDNMVHFANTTSFSDWGLGKRASPTALELLHLRAESGLARPWILPVLAGLTLLLLLFTAVLRRHR